MTQIGERKRWFQGAILALGMIAGTIIGAAAQQAGTTPVIALLSTRTPEDGPTRAFFDEMRALGYIEGQNIRIEARWAGGENERLSAMAVELAALNPRVVVANSEPGIRAAKNAVGGTPLVMANVGD